MHKKAIAFAKTTITHPLFSGSAILVVGSMGANVINYVYTVMLGKILQPANYAILMSIYSVLYLASIIPASSSLAIVKFIAASKTEKEQRATYSAILSLGLKIALVGGVIIVFISPAIANFLHVSDIGSVIILAPVFFFSVLSLVNQSTSQGRLKFLGMVVPTISMSVIKFVLGVAFVLLGWAVFGAMLGVAFGALASFLVSIIFLRSFRTTKQKASFSLSKFFSYSRPVLIQSIAFTSLMSTDVILVKHFFGGVDAGVYAAVSTLGRIIFFAAQPVSGAMFPIIAKRHAVGEKYSKVVLASLAATMGIAIPAMLAFLIIPNLIITVSYGNSYAQAGGALVWMGAFYTVYTLAYFLNNFFFSRGQTRVAMFAVFAAIMQIVGIVLFHSSLISVIQVSLIIGTILTLILLVFYVWERKKR